jgi:hypothetical protein
LEQGPSEQGVAELTVPGAAHERFTGVPLPPEAVPDSGGERASDGAREYEFARTLSSGRDNKDTLTVRQLPRAASPPIRSYSTEEVEEAALVAEAEWLFSQTDEDDSGDLDRMEVQRLFAMSGMTSTMTADDVDFQIAELCDGSGGGGGGQGRVSKEKFLNWCVQLSCLIFRVLGPIMISQCGLCLLARARVCVPQVAEPQGRRYAGGTHHLLLEQHER